MLALRRFARRIQASLANVVEFSIMKEPGLDKRHRDKDGEIERKKGNTRVDSLRKTYGEDFLSDWRGDAHLETVLEEEGVESLSELVKDHRKTKR